MGAPYQFRVPVIVSRNVSFPTPAENMWTISLCHKSLCWRANDEHTMVNFVVAGFEVGVAPSTDSGPREPHHGARSAMVLDVSASRGTHRRSSPFLIMGV